MQISYDWGIESFKDFYLPDCCAWLRANKGTHPLKQVDLVAITRPETEPVGGKQHIISERESIAAGD